MNVYVDTLKLQKRLEAGRITIPTITATRISPVAVCCSRG